MKKIGVFFVLTGLLLSCGPLDKMATQRLIQEITWGSTGDQDHRTQSHHIQPSLFFTLICNR
ncbi:MAG: hypothetical protein KJ768_04720 [Acidobacteria bacterium]|nr:hypothetical protein [Acidobacteriota bacterium]